MADDKKKFNLYADVSLFIHDVLEDPKTKNNPEMVAAITGLLEIVTRD